MKKSFITHMPDQVGAFLIASKIMSQNGGNIVRVSYNKALDTHALFIDVSAEDEKIEKITEELSKIGYLPDYEMQPQVILMEFKIRDVPGAVYPILEILNKHHINITYINSIENGTLYQNFKMGLLIENTRIVKLLLDEISKICEVHILDYNRGEKILDNTVFYFDFANEIKEKVGFSQRDLSEFIENSNKLMHMLEIKNKPIYKTFDYIRKFADFMARYRGDKFQPRITRQKVTDKVIIYLIEPPCGSNIYILKGADKILFIDTGFAFYRDEMFRLFHSLFSNFDQMEKSVYITHTDMDHCGLLNDFDTIYLNKTGYENFKLESEKKPNFREQNSINASYCQLSRIISKYRTPNCENLHVINKKAPDRNELLSYIGDFEFEDLKLEVFEGNGGHIQGEMIFVCREHAVIFTGDNFVNIDGFTKEQYDFNVLAPYLMTSVNIDSAKANLIRKEIMNLISNVEVSSKKQCLICPGHGAFCTILNNRVIPIGVEYNNCI